MIKLQHFKEILTGKRKLIDVWYYLQGNYRYWLYYGDDSYMYVGGKGHNIKPILMRKHIWEQIAWRIKVMNRECYNNGECIKCGCQTTHLQMCDKPCEGACYPQMLDKEGWDRFLKGYCTPHKVSNEITGYWLGSKTLSIENPDANNVKMTIDYYPFEK